MIWDCTYERGRMWRGLDVQPVIKSDIKPIEQDVARLDYRELHKDWHGGGVDLLVFDPPHAMHGGAKGGMAEGGWGDTYGTRADVAIKTKELSIAWTFADFLLSARHVMDEHGIILAKLGDQTHGTRNQWEHCRMWSAALACGFTPCDLLIKVRQEPKRRDPKHKHQYHFDKILCYFVVIRAGVDNC